MDGLVLDCSVTMSWCFSDEADPYAKAVLKALPSVTAYVPVIWSLEVANVLVVGERRRRLVEADSARFIALLGALPITTDYEASDRALTEVINLARRCRLASYDAAYLELAMRRGLPLAAIDEPLRRAAADLGIQMYSPP